MGLRPFQAVVLSGAVQLALAGCASTARVDPSEFAALPDDFTLDVTVLAGRDVHEQYGAHLQPMRYVVMPDGTLRSGPATAADDARPVVAAGSASDASVHAGAIASDSLPGVTRVLSRAQMESLWALARDAGLADPARREPPLNLALFAAPRDRMMYVAQFQAGDVNWSVRGPAPLVPPATAGSDGATAAEGGADSIAIIDPTLTTLVRRLAALAWVSDEPPSARRPAPIRYDFGPDPYARYCEP